jgi:hypothetical protein
MAAMGTLVGLSADELNSIRAAALQCIVANSVRGISYSIAGRQFTFPSMSDCQQLLLETNYALGILTGQRSANVRTNFNYAIGRGTPQG